MIFKMMFTRPVHGIYYQAHWWSALAEEHQQKGFSQVGDQEVVQWAQKAWSEEDARHQDLEDSKAQVDLLPEVSQRRHRAPSGQQAI